MANHKAVPGQNVLYCEDGVVFEVSILCYYDDDYNMTDDEGNIFTGSEANIVEYNIDDYDADNDRL